MRSAISSFEARLRAWWSPALFRKDLCRFWPVWTLYGAVWTLILPVHLFRARLDFDMAPGYWTTGLVLDTIPIGIPLSLIFGLLAAMAVFSYLYNSRAALLMHALPIRREGLFLTSYLAGLSFLVLPILAVGLLALGAEVLAGRGVDAGLLFLWGWCQVMMSFFFYSFAVFCGMFTGQLLALPAFYGILNVLVLGLWQLSNTVAGCLLFGFSYDRGCPAWVEWLTPVYCYSIRVGDTGSPEYRFTGLTAIFFYAFVGLVLAVLSLLLYQRRQVESAGDIVSVPWVRPIFKYGAAFCTAMALGPFLWALFCPDQRRSDLWVLLAVLLLAGALGYFVAEMFLRKSFRVFRTGWKGCAVFLVLLSLGAGMLRMDPFGFEDRVPDAGQVASISFTNGQSFPPYDDACYPTSLDRAEDIRHFIAFHQSVVDHKAEIREAVETGGDSVFAREEILRADDPSWEFSWVTLSFTYRFTDGGRMSRTYRIPVTKALLADPESPAARLDDLINAPGFCEELYFSRYAPGDKLIHASLSTTGNSDLEFDGSDAQRLLSAVRDDLADGTLGRHYLMDSAERSANCYWNDLTFTFSLSGQRDAPRTEDPPGNVYEITVTVQAGAERTLSVLQELGAGEDLILWSDID
ncbi:hypothetical protein [Pseudoflavonifractor sp. MSJ-37]|uniref:hypothetical protein n=1 Tax=Pseudoflavonifractor sp. MSJ-37 TaxID=2841531 RepID=UPI001C11E4C3|nr:hypothetical protein [Pseudoflavonifractor sp. MSJ-37]MBU5435426.1 hypothetical protein [Pseudoflavonifractor sp. MSJ-37]